MLHRMNDDFPVLAAVAAYPAHPYALLDHLQGMGVPVSRSTLYRRVEALVGEGLLTARAGRGESGHYRRALKLTRRGRDRVAREAVEVLRTEPLESPLFALAVAVAEADGPERLGALLRPRMAGAARALTQEEFALRQGEDAAFGRAARERRVAHLRADLAWLQGLMKAS